ncbi:Hypothetical protein PHPALM_14153 [Phytophthora palmivora]|uniref:Uncharacterized protein n=1 Tax=Phytophthora palmivora TaxID=4796 RepID=A0A2P4XVF3_9STRA|nr:Hypothetical protein PHPALM_14153 [Phytophthora palmivora]
MFDKIGGEDEDPDHKQSLLPLQASMFWATMTMLHKELCFLLRMHDQNYVPTAYSFMKSEMNGREQDPHNDYTPAVIAKFTDKHPEIIPSINLSGVSSFREDMIYCGVANPKVNFRLHCYVTIGGTVAGVNEGQFTCEHRGHQEAASTRNCQHRVY